MNKEAFLEEVYLCKRKVLETTHPVELKQLIMHFFLFTKMNHCKNYMDQALEDELCLLYYSIESIEDFSDHSVRSYLFQICIDRALLLFDEIIKNC